VEENVGRGSGGGSYLTKTSEEKFIFQDLESKDCRMLYFI